MERRFITRVRVRSYELDMLGHVNNAVFLNWLEQARLEAFERIGWSLEALIARRWMTHVVRIEIDYRREVRFGDEVVVLTRVEGIGRTSLTLAHSLERAAPGAGARSGEGRARAEDGSEPEVVAEARVVVVWLGQDGRPTPVPEEVRRSLATPAD